MIIIRKRQVVAVNFMLGKVFTDEDLDKVEITRLGGRKIPADQGKFIKRWAEHHT